MCAATVGAVAAVAGTAASVGATAYSMSQQDKGGGASAFPRQTPLKAFAPANALQGWAARLLAMNANASPPSLMEWAASGGEAELPLEIPEFTPKEAQMLKFVDDYGDPYETYAPGQGRLTDKQYASIGAKRARARALGKIPASAPMTPAEKFFEHGMNTRVQSKKSDFWDDVVDVIGKTDPIGGLKKPAKKAIGKFKDGTGPRSIGKK